MKLLLNPGIRELQIDLCRGQGIVAQQLLNRRQLRTLFVKMRREGVTQHAWRQEAEPDTKTREKSDRCGSSCSRRPVRSHVGRSATILD